MHGKQSEPESEVSRETIESKVREVSKESEASEGSKDNKIKIKGLDQPTCEAFFVEVQVCDSETKGMEAIV